MKKLAFICLLVFSAATKAEVQPISMPGDTKLVVFNYDQNNTYSIYTMPGMITDIQLGDDEKLSAFAFGDSIQWITADADGHLFVKPTLTGLYTSATIVTNKRSYQLTFKSVADGQKWYQRVSWHYPQMIMLHKIEEQKNQERPLPLPEEKKFVAAEQKTSDESTVNQANVNSLNFDYTIDGDADFKPEQVFDDGTFTYLKINSHAQELPAMFIVNDSKDTELANYLVKGSYMLLQRTANTILLKLGDKEVKISKKKKGWW